MNSSEPFQQISKRKVLYVDLDEEITTLFERIERLPYREVYLVVPERAILFQSAVNLTLLKSKVEGLEKSLSLITSDPIGIKLAHQAKVTVYDQLQAPAPTKAKKVEVKKGDDENGAPIAAAVNELSDSRPERLKEKKLSIFEIVKRVKQERSFSLKAMKDRWSHYRKNKALTKAPSRFALGAPSAKTLGTLVAASVVVLLFISYIALPGATVVVTPQSNVLEQSINITLANASVYGTKPSLGTPGHTLAYFPIETTIEKALVYSATGQIFDGTHAQGTVTLINERNTPWQLVAFTRLQTEEGLVFRTQQQITVPSATLQGFGTVEVGVVADETDAYERVVGERGNIGPSSFVLPGLREDSRKELYGRSSAPMTGGSTVVTLKIRQEDLDAAEDLLRHQLESVAEQALLEEVQRRNDLNTTHLQLLTGGRAIQRAEPSISIPAYLVEAIQDSFEVKGSLKVTGYAFDQTEFEKILTEELTQRKSPDKVLLRIDPDSVVYEIFELEKTSSQIKLTATIKGIEAYDFNAETENGARLIKKIKEHISGKPIREAEDYIQNLPEINSVTIKSWPVWAPTIPTVLENIEVEVEGGMIEDTSNENKS